MRFCLITSTLLLLAPLGLFAAETQKLYRWVDRDGIVHYGDSIPAEYADIERQVVNEHGITVDVLRGKKSEAEIAEEKRLENLRVQRELQRRADIALLATYLSIDEIIMHRDRRVELFQAQARVTELYLRNLQRRLVELESDASKFRPYSENEDAPMIDDNLVKELTTTKEAIARHERNLQKFQDDEESIVARFDGDIDRFRELKGLN